MTLAEHFYHEGAYCEESNPDGDRRNGRYRHLLLPPVGGGTRGLGKRRHNALLNAHREVYAFIGSQVSAPNWG